MMTCPWLHISVWASKGWLTEGKGAPHPSHVILAGMGWFGAYRYMPFSFFLFSRIEKYVADHCRK